MLTTPKRRQATTPGAGALRLLLVSALVLMARAIPSVTVSFEMTENAGTNHKVGSISAMVGRDVKNVQRLNGEQLEVKKNGDVYTTQDVDRETRCAINAPLCTVDAKFMVEFTDGVGNSIYNINVSCRAFVVDLYRGFYLLLCSFLVVYETL